MARRVDFEERSLYRINEHRRSSRNAVSGWRSHFCRASLTTEPTNCRRCAGQMGSRPEFVAQGGDFVEHNRDFVGAFRWHQKNKSRAATLREIFQYSQFVRRTKQ
jgi:hypothetical protein